MESEKVVNDVRAAIFGYLLEESDLNALVSEFNLATQSHLDTLSDEAAELVSEVRVLLAELGRGDRDEDSLRDELRLIAKAAFGTYSGTSAPTTSLHTGSSSSVRPVAVLPVQATVVTT